MSLDLRLPHLFIDEESLLGSAMQDCVSGQSPQHDQSSRVNAQLTMMQSAVSILVNALHTEWYNNIPQDLAIRLRRPLLFQVSIPILPSYDLCHMNLYSLREVVHHLNAQNCLMMRCLMQCRTKLLAVC